MVGLGPGAPGSITIDTEVAIADVGRRFVRTRRHPSAGAVPDAVSFDDIYDAAESIDEVYPRIVEVLVSAAIESRVALYAVPGSPLVAEHTVELLRIDGRVKVEILPGLSFVDLAWARLGIDPLADGVRIVDGRRFAVEAAGERGPLLVAQCDSRQVLSDIKLVLGETVGGSDAHGDGPLEAVVLSRLGLPDESVYRVAWFDLDREVNPDHLTSLYLGRMAAPVAAEVARFVALVRDLRDRCPWDREQTHASLTRHLLEEAYEVLEAIEGLPADEAYDNLEEELGDLLFQVVFHSTLAAEEGRFTLADVAKGVHDKLVSRHPHVFGTVTAETTGEVVGHWERIKKAEKGRASVMDGIPASLPALLYAAKVQRKAASLGVDPVAGDGGAGSDEIGTRLFSLVDESRRRGSDAEDALRVEATQFANRFRAFEALTTERGLDVGELTDEDRQLLWAAAGEGSDLAGS